MEMLIKFWAWITNTTAIEVIEIDGKVTIAFAIKHIQTNYIKFNGKPVVLKSNGSVVQDYPFTIRAWRKYE